MLQNTGVTECVVIAQPPEPLLPTLRRTSGEWREKKDKHKAFYIPDIVKLHNIAVRVSKMDGSRHLPPHSFAPTREGSAAHFQVEYEIGLGGNLGSTCDDCWCFANTLQQVYPRAHLRGVQVPPAQLVWLVCCCIESGLGIFTTTVILMRASGALALAQ